LAAASRVVVVEPCYTEYLRAAEQVGLDCHRILAKPQDAFETDFGELESQLQTGDLLILGQPNNPTGRLLDQPKLEALIEARPDVSVVIDEAFLDFVPKAPSMGSMGAKNLVVLRSLTKFWAIPGLRLGYAIAPERWAQALRGQLPPWSVNGVAQAVGLRIFDPGDLAYARATLALIDQQRDALQRDLAKLDGVSLWNSAANFILTAVETYFEFGMQHMRPGSSTPVAQSLLDLVLPLLKLPVTSKTESTISAVVDVVAQVWDMCENLNGQPAWLFNHVKQSFVDCLALGSIAPGRIIDHQVLFKTFCA